MANTRHPNFILGIIAIIAGAAAIGFYANKENSTGSIFIIITAVLGVISWVWSIIEVQKTNTLQGSQKKFWRIAVIAVPFVGGMLYHLLHSKPDTIVD
jgi:drug/metabolite transporter (DMT)-like permease